MRDVTLPHNTVGSIPTKTVRIEVMEGPDAGRIALANAETLSVGTAAGNGMVLTCPTVSQYHVELTGSREGILVSDCGSTNGTHVGTVRIDRAIVPPRTVLRLGRTSVMVSDGESRTVTLHDSDVLCGLRGRTPVMRRLMAEISQVAPSDASVLLVGESGTGKELVAEALHQLGHRRSGPFVTVDCAAMTPTLIASDLFGHERNAFTGAQRARAGAFELANGGTLFLDEIGELPSELQISLLGVLERRRFRRLGGERDISVDVRVVSATNRDLRSEVNAGRFRLDLYYRLAVVVLRLPALRERSEDIALLAETFLREAGHAGAIEEIFPPAALASLEKHRWPGNVRELRNLVEATLATGAHTALDHPAFDGRDNDVPAAEASATGDLITPLLGMRYKAARSSILSQFEHRYLSDLLVRCEGNVARAAREAQIDRSQLIQLIKRNKLR